MKRTPKFKERSGVEILEESCQLLRDAPPRILAIYLLGTAPFLLGFLYFWADMSGSAFAQDHLAEGALAVSLLFVWKSLWQAIFASELRGQLADSPPKWSIANVAATAVIQTAIQSTSLLVIPVGAVLILPFGTVFGFYRTSMVLAGDTSAKPRILLRRALGAAGLWQGQTWVALAIASLLALLVLINLLAMFLIVPQLLKSFFGIEFAFTRNIAGIFNLTFLMVLCSLVYLCLDPLLTAMYALRVFYADSRESGRDLSVALQRARVAAGFLFCILLFGFATAVQAQTANPAVATPTLDRSIDQVLKRSEFVWRMPRPPIEEKDRGFAISWLESLSRLMDRMMQTVKEWAEWIRRWFEPLRYSPDAGGTKGAAPSTTLKWLTYAVGAVAACAVAFLLFRLLRNRKAPKPVLAGVAASVAIDLNDDSITADQMPESSWLALAQDWLAKGDRRMALRAFHLATLNYLARRELILLQRWKSNYEYEIELRRRARAMGAAIGPVFASNVGIFERGWYGYHEVDDEALTAYRSNLETLRSHAGQ